MKMTELAELTERMNAMLQRLPKRLEKRIKELLVEAKAKELWREPTQVDALTDQSGVPGSPLVHAQSPLTWSPVTYASLLLGTKEMDSVQALVDQVVAALVPP